jgi:methylated-DNA-[protein]-cysteine S-methyltransferase
MSVLKSLLINTPFAQLALYATDEALVRLDFVADADVATEISRDVHGTRHPLLVEAQRQLLAYCENPHFNFDLPWQLVGSEHQQKVWQQIASIKSGETLRYLDIAQRIQSSPRAVGGACGRNPLPIFVPCHRVLAANGLGGFNANRNGLDWMPIKRWLLRHEGIIQ